MNIKVSFLKRLSKFRVVLPRSDSRNLLLETHFTMLEIAALKKAWTMIESKIKKFSQKAATVVYLEHPEWIELFRHDGRIVNNVLINQPLLMLDIYGNIIKTNLHNNYALAETLLPILETHWNRLIPMPHLADYLDCLKDQVLHELQDNLSPTTELAFEKLNHKILYFFTTQQKRINRSAKF